MSEKPAPRATLAKVALLAKVSTATASNVLAGKGGASEATAQRIRAAARSIGYRADAKARALSRGPSTTVGVIVTDTTDQLIQERLNLYWGILMESFVAEASRSGLVVAFVQQAQLQALIDSGVDAVVTLGPDPVEISTEMPFGLPVISAALVQRGGVIAYDVPAIADRIANEFAAADCASIGWVRQANDPLVEELTAAVPSAFSALGLTLSVFESLDAATADTAVDGVFGTFENPRELLDQLAETGRGCPEVVRVVSFGEGLFEAMTSPTVTTLDLCADRTGELLATLVRAVIEGSPLHAVDAPFQLVRRESTGDGS